MSRFGGVPELEQISEFFYLACSASARATTGCIVKGLANKFLIEFPHVKRTLSRSPGKGYFKWPVC